MLKKIQIVLALSVLTALTLSGCGQFKSLPKEERYKPINDLAAEIDYQSTGEIISEEYGGGDGVFGSSFLQVEVSGKSTFADLVESVKSAPDIRECTQSIDYLRCEKGSVIVTVSHRENRPEEVYLYLADTSNGRD